MSTAHRWPREESEIKDDPKRAAALERCVRGPPETAAAHVAQ
jgi:hypothetical protein